jgi:hypothetical protein
MVNVFVSAKAEWKMIPSSQKILSQLLKNGLMPVLNVYT